MTHLADNHAPHSSERSRRLGGRGLRSVRPLGIALALSLVVQPALAQKTDVVVLNNGDRITGEVKTLYSGRLEYSTDPAKTMLIRWDYVVKLTSANFFEVVLSTGERRFGALLEPEEPETLRVGLEELYDDVPLEKVARIERLRTSFWSRLKGSVDAGVTLTKADSRREVNLKGDVNYRTPKWRFGISTESIRRTQATTDDFIRDDTSASVQRFFGGRWLGLGLASVERNSELALARRYIGVLGGGYHVVRTVEHDLIGAAGLGLQTEKFTDGRESSESVEAMFALSYTLFALGRHDFTVTASAVAYPSLSVKGRFRSLLDVDLRKELVKDLYVSLRGYISTDNSTEGEDAAQTDYNVTASVGWKF